ncbi:MAG: hypothetical protein J5772_01610 [Clostridia bacterium]|nr:hypothetical protein [Clostridia bacterium]
MGEVLKNEEYSGINEAFPPARDRSGFPPAAARDHAPPLPIIGARARKVNRNLPNKAFLMERKRKKHAL